MSIGTARPCTVTTSSSPGRWVALTCGRLRMCRNRTESGDEPKWKAPRKKIPSTGPTMGRPSRVAVARASRHIPVSRSHTCSAVSLRSGVMMCSRSGSYQSLWTTKLSIRIGGGGISADLRHWVNEGLMTFFFLVIGLEAKRELDVGQLRERRRIAVPLFAAIGGMTVPVLIYLAVNAGGSGAHGWGTAMSTDTAFVLGVLALVAPGGTRLRIRLLTVAVIDDLVALVVIATAYTHHVSVVPLAVAIGLFIALLA